MAHIFQSSDYGAELEAEKQREAEKKAKKEAAKAQKAAERWAAQHELDGDAAEGDDDAGDAYDPLDKLSILTAASTRSSHELHIGVRLKRGWKRFYRKWGLKDLISVLVIAIYTIVGGIFFYWAENAHDLATQAEGVDTWRSQRAAFLADLEATGRATYGSHCPVCEECACSAAKEQIFDQMGLSKLFFKLNSLDESLQRLEPVIGRLQEIADFNYMSTAARSDLQEALGWYKDKVAEFDASAEGMKLRAKVQTTQKARSRRQAEPVDNSDNATLKAAQSDNPFEAPLAKYEADTGFTVSVDQIWYFWNCMYFAATLYTTIGYGNIACVTVFGRIVTVVYGFIGIPMFIGTLNDVGNWLYRILHMFICWKEEKSKAFKKRFFPKEKPSPTKTAIFAISSGLMDLETGGPQDNDVMPGGFSSLNDTQMMKRRDSRSSDMTMGHSWFLWAKAPLSYKERQDAVNKSKATADPPPVGNAKPGANKNVLSDSRSVQSVESHTYEEIGSHRRANEELALLSSEELRAVESRGRRSPPPYAIAAATDADASESGSGSGGSDRVCGRYEQQLHSAVKGRLPRYPRTLTPDILLVDADGVERVPPPDQSENPYQNLKDASKHKKSTVPALATAFLSPSVLMRAHPSDEYELETGRMLSAQPFLPHDDDGSGEDITSDGDTDTGSSPHPVGFAQSFRRSTKTFAKHELVDERSDSDRSLLRKASKASKASAKHSSAEDDIPPDPISGYVTRVAGKPFPEGDPEVMSPDDLLDNIESLKDDPLSADDEAHDEMLDEEEETAPSTDIPVSVAAFATFGWIFFCAALFCIWEDWTYWESCYFFFISLSTIGLGDFVPARPDYMVGCLMFIIIGLSLVSMCITIVQQAIEKAYMDLLMSILMEYQKKMEEGGDQVGAAAGMMDAWNSNLAAKLLLPLMGADKKANVMAKFQDEAKAKGMELPPVLQNIDRATGLPAIVSDSKKDDDAEDMMARITASVQKAEQVAEKPKVETRSAQTQTDDAEAAKPSRNTVVQTDWLETDDSAVQTDEDEGQTKVTTADDEQQTDSITPVCTETQTVDVEQSSVELQTEEPEPEPVVVPEKIDFNEQVGMPPDYLTVSETQTSVVEMRSTEIETDSVTLMESQMQTTVIQTSDEEQQTLVVEIKGRGTQTPIVKFASISLETEPPPVVDQLVQTEEMEKLEEAINTEDLLAKLENPETSETEQQTEAVLTEDDMTQTSQPDPIEAEAQTMHTGPIPSAYPISLFAKEPTPEPEPEPEAESSSSEELAWDPVDGMHAEKQLPVGNLRSMFESGKVAQPQQPAKRGGKKHSTAGAGPSRSHSLRGGKTQEPPPPIKKLW